MKLIREPYQTQLERWPRLGRHILAQFNDQSIIVYQAYCPEIGHYAAKTGCFGGPFSLHRMTRVKPSFLWMMCRSHWGTSEDQEVTLAIRLPHSAFDAIIGQAVHSTFVGGAYGNEAEWANAVKRSDVRLQWDPDRDPPGMRLERRAIQLGLRGETLKRYAREWIIDIEDISEFVREQRECMRSRPTYGKLITPREAVYCIDKPEVAARLKLS